MKIWKIGALIAVAATVGIAPAVNAQAPKPKNICGRMGDQNSYNTYDGCINFHTGRGWSTAEAAQGCRRGCRGAR